MLLRVGPPRTWPHPLGPSPSTHLPGWGPYLAVVKVLRGRLRAVLCPPEDVSGPSRQDLQVCPDWEVGSLQV